MVRTLRRDIAKYNEEDAEDALEQTGWKLVHGDVFRPPENLELFSVIIGSGCQLFCMITIAILFSMFGMISPATRGSLMTSAIFMYMFFGIVGGFAAGRLYKTLGGKNWLRTASGVVMFFPGITFGVGFILNLFVWNDGSSGAIPFTTMLVLVVLWFGISGPLVIIGAYFGYRKDALGFPVSVNQIPRQIPEQQTYMHPVISVLLAGILPFGAVFIELFFILSAIWENQFYYLFGFLFLVFIILVISCAEIAIVMTYLQLCSEDYAWWWRSFMVCHFS